MIQIGMPPWTSEMADNEKIFEDNDDVTDWDFYIDISSNAHERKSSNKLRNSKKAFIGKIEPLIKESSDHNNLMESDLKVIGWKTSTAVDISRR